MTEDDRSLLDRRLIIVTGKGGVGKTAVSCALAEAARRAGKKVLLAETASLESVASNFEEKPAPLGYAGRTLRPGLHAMRIDPYDALADYIRLQMGIGAVTDRILKTETFRQFFEAAPGWRELIILGAIWHNEQKRDASGKPVYDVVIVDAPATGHGLTFLDVPRVVQQTVQSGPLARHSSWVEELVHDRERTLLLPVTLGEELPVTETAELVQRARDEIDIGLDRIIVNRLPIDPGHALVQALEQLPSDLGLETLPPVDDLRPIVEHAQHRSQLARAQRDRVSRVCDLPVVDLPNIPAGFSATSGWQSQADRLLEAPRWPGKPSAGASAA